MSSIGDTVRRERLRRNLELPQIAGQLKISARFLEAIEHDDFAKLPGGVFTKSFVRQYAGFLGLDGEELAAAVGQSVDPEPNAATLTDKPKPDVPGIELEMGEDSWRSVRERRSPLPSWLRAGVLLIVLMLVCSGVYWWWQKPHRQVLARETPPAPRSLPVSESAARPSPPVARPAENRPAEAAPSGVQPVALASGEPAIVAPAAAPAPPSNLSNPNATVRVAITADELVWVRADVNGKEQFEVTLQPHESRNIDADGEVTLRLGNAGGATITLNGKPVGEVGPKGQIRTVQFTSGGFQIVSPPPKALDPLDRL